MYTSTSSHRHRNSEYIAYVVQPMNSSSVIKSIQVDCFVQKNNF